MSVSVSVIQSGTAHHYAHPHRETSGQSNLIPADLPVKVFQLQIELQTRVQLQLSLPAMPRRRTRAKEPEPEPVEEDEQLQQATAESEPEPEPMISTEPGRQDGDDGDQDIEQHSLQFSDELSWRPAKPIPSATLLDRLERLSKELAEFDQGGVHLDSLKDVAASLAHRNLLQHKDRGVKAYAACCLVDILRLFVPDAPFTDDQLKVRLRSSLLTGTERGGISLTTLA